MSSVWVCFMFVISVRSMGMFYMYLSGCWSFSSRSLVWKESVVSSTTLWPIWNEPIRRCETSTMPCRSRSAPWRRNYGKPQRTIRSWWRAGWPRKHRRPTNSTLRTRRTPGQKHTLFNSCFYLKSWYWTVCVNKIPFLLYQL